MRIRHVTIAGAAAGMLFLFAPVAHAVCIDQNGVGSGPCPNSFRGTAQQSGYGTGQASGTMQLDFVNGSSFASYTAREDAGTCPATGTADGTISGVASGNFHWTRVGALALLSFAGGNVNGADGVMAFVVTSPLGNPCGGPVTATVAGVID